MGSCQVYLSLTFDHPINCKTVKYINQSNNSSQLLLSVDISRFGRFVVEKLVENMTHEMTLCRMLLYYIGVLLTKDLTNV